MIHIYLKLEVPNLLMEATILTVHWHNDNQPIYSVDFQPEQPELANSSTSMSTESTRLATGGGDNNIRIWRLTSSNSVEYMSTLQKHSQAVNAVRFNPRGDILASAGDDGTLLLWKKSEAIVKTLESEDDEDLKESWQVVGTIRSSTAEIMDICWSPNGDQIVTGSMDNILRIYQLEFSSGKVSGTIIRSFSDHTHYIQGVFWDPLNKFIVSQSADRSVNVYLILQSESKSIEINLKQKFQKFGNLYLYYPETLQSFFRRLAFSPDGSILVTPAGLEETSNNETLNNVLYIYSRASLLTSPIYKITGLSKPAIAVSFNPIRYKLDGTSTLKLPYKLVFAVATQDGVVLYSTRDNFKPLGLVSNLHYSSITDLKWTIDGSRIIVSSTDGFCSTINFPDSAFGERYTDGQVSVPHNNGILLEEILQAKTELNLESAVSSEIPNENLPNPKNENSQSSTPPIDLFFDKNQKVKKRITPTLIL